VLQEQQDLQWRKIALVFSHALYFLVFGNLWFVKYARNVNWEERGFDTPSSAAWGKHEVWIHCGVMILPFCLFCRSKCKKWEAQGRRNRVANCGQRILTRTLETQVKSGRTAILAGVASLVTTFQSTVTTNAALSFQQCFWLNCRYGNRFLEFRPWHHFSGT
jgi:hypothetical protein